LWNDCANVFSIDGDFDVLATEWYDFVFPVPPLKRGELEQRFVVVVAVSVFLTVANKALFRESL